MPAWDALKKAALEYSSFRPHYHYQELTPATGTKQQTAPEGALGVESCSYGEEFTLVEVLSGATTAQGWCFANGYLYVTPAPADTTPIVVVWKVAHAPDEVTQSFPTISPREFLYVEKLAEAADAEVVEAALDAGLSSYTIGGTTVKWSKDGGGQPSGASRATRLRAEVYAALGTPSAEWG